jgi:hypothetical protein
MEPRIQLSLRPDDPGLFPEQQTQRGDETLQILPVSTDAKSLGP